MGNAAEPLVVYVSPNGMDESDGLNIDASVRTLHRVQEILNSTLSDQHRDVEVRIAPGVYRKQSVRWTFTMPENEIVFQPLGEENVRPVFDGETNRGTWFQLRHSLGQKTNLTFRHIHVKNYATAISLNGDRNDPMTCNRSNTISGCLFSNIGEGSTAAVRLVNSKNNVIVDNLFVDILRSKSCGLLHAIYIAHHSSENQILRNRFENCCGDPIRVRDDSNENVVNDNRFIHAGIAAAYTEWYCDQRRNDDSNPKNNCTKPTPECPSWGNEFRNNHLQKNFRGEKLSAWHLSQKGAYPFCTAPSPDAKRVRTSGNISE